MRQRLMIGAPAALLLAFSAAMGPAAFAQRQVVLPKDSVLKVKLDDRLSSDSNQRGDRFTATVTDTGTGDNLPAGTRVEGTVTEVQPASSNRPGSLDVDFNALRLPDGQSYRIAGSPISLDSKSVQRTSDGRLMASSSSSKNKMKFLAYGAGAGFVIGSLLGSNIKGALAGGAAGYLYGMLNKNKANGHDVVLNPGTQFGVRLDQRVALASANGYGYRQGFATRYGANQRSATGYGNNQRSTTGYGYNRPSAAGYGSNTLSHRAPARYAANEVVLPADSVLKVKLDNTLSSNQNQPGDRFTATVSGGDSGYNLPSGTRVEGVVREAQPGSNDQPGSLDVDFNALRLPDGQTYQINGAPISLDSKSVQRTSDGRLMAHSGSSSKNRTKFLAYGAGAGFVIGSLLGSNIKGALAGAAAGYLYGMLNKNKANGRDVVLKPGTEFGVRLDQRVALGSPGGYGYR
jgi:hypothetical protein